MALTPEARPAWQSSGNLPPATDIRPMTGVWYDAAGIAHVSYMEAPPPPGITSPSLGAAAPGSFSAVTKSDTTLLPTGVQSLWVGGAGNVVVQGIDGVTATFTAVPAGTLLRGQFTRVMAATTATNIVALV
jgi:hypothetical protein